MGRAPHAHQDWQRTLLALPGGSHNLNAVSAHSRCPASAANPSTQAQILSAEAEAEAEEAITKENPMQETEGTASLLIPHRCSFISGYLSQPFHRRAKSGPPSSASCRSWLLAPTSTSSLWMANGGTRLRRLPSPTGMEVSTTPYPSSKVPATAHISSVLTFITESPMNILPQL